MTHEEELNKAAELWIAGVFLAYSVPDTSVKELREIAEKSFIAGYKLAMEQGVVADGEIGYWNQTGLSILLDKSLEKLGFDMDEKVIIQIRKKDE